jgi:hypothetical protein
MDKAKKAELRKLRKKAIKRQNSSASKLTMAEAIRLISSETDGQI